MAKQTKKELRAEIRKMLAQEKAKLEKQNARAKKQADYKALKECRKKGCDFEYLGSFSYAFGCGSFKKYKCRRCGKVTESGGTFSVF